MTDKGVGMTIIPMDIKEGMGIGTTFRVIGDFNGIVKQQILNDRKEFLLK